MSQLASSVNQSWLSSAVVCGGAPVPRLSMRGWVCSAVLSTLASQMGAHLDQGLKKGVVPAVPDQKQSRAWGTRRGHTATQQKEAGQLSASRVPAPCRSSPLAPPPTRALGRLPAPQ